MASWGEALAKGAPVTRSFLPRECRDTIALIDPDSRFGIRFPSCKVMAGQTVLEFLLRHLLENAAKYAQSGIAVTLQAGPARGLIFRVFDDGVGPQESHRGDGSKILPPSANGPDYSALGRADSLLQSQNSSLALCRDADGLVGLEFTIRGTILEPPPIAERQRDLA